MLKGIDRSSMVSGDKINPTVADTNPGKTARNVLIVDDDVSILTVLKTLLTREGFDVVTADSSEKGLKILRKQRFDLLLSDIVMQPFDGITLLRQAREINPNNQVVMMTGYATIETATEALKLGAFDYICKPFKIDELLATVKRAVSFIEKFQGSKNNDGKKKIYLIKKHFGELVGESSEMQEVYKQIEKVAMKDDPLFIRGECGTGKSLVAKAIHSAGNRKDFPFLYFNCAICPEHLIDATLFGYVQLPRDNDGNIIKGLPVIKKGLFELARGGSILFEHIGALPKWGQAKLVSVIKKNKFMRTGSTKEVHLDVRFIADSVETSQNIQARKDLNPDLSVLINKSSIVLPILLERKGDLSILIDHLMIQYNQLNHAQVTISQKAQKALENYRWPGNVHELKSTIFRAAQVCKKGQIQLSNLPVPVRMCFMRSKASIFGYTDDFDLRWWSLRKFLKTKEREYVDEVLKITKGDKMKAAKLLGIDLATFYKKYGNN